MKELNGKEKRKIEVYFEDKYPESFDLIDVEAMTDSSLTVRENIRLIQEEFDKIEKTPEKELIKLHEEQCRVAEAENGRAIKNIEDTELEEDWQLWHRVLPEVKSIVTIGTTGSGKTAHSLKILETAKHIMPDRKIYVFRHPKPKLIEKLGFNNLYNIEQLDRLNKAVCYIDEPQTQFKLYDRRENTMLATLLTLARQRDILLIISTSMTQWVTRMLEGGVDCWICKDVDFDSVKQGSRVREIIKQNSLLDASFFKLEPDEYLFYCRKFPEYSGKHRFIKPRWFDENCSKPYAVETATKSAKESALCA